MSIDLIPDRWALGLTFFAYYPAEFSLSRRLTDELWLTARARLMGSSLFNKRTIISGFFVVDDGTVDLIPGVQLRHFWMRPNGWWGLELGYGLSLGNMLRSIFVGFAASFLRDMTKQSRILKWS